MNIPILTFHLGTQDYLRKSIAHNAKFGNVTLIGNTENYNFCDNWIDVRCVSAEWDRVKQYNYNYSFYDDWYWDACLSLYFYIKEYLIQHEEIQKFIHVESDCLIYRKIADVKSLVKYDAGFPVNEGAGNIALAFFSRDAFFHLCDFIENLLCEKNKIMELWTAYKASNKSGGISDMTMLYLWLKSKPPFQFKNMLEYDFDEAMVIENIAWPHNLIQNEYIFNKYLLIKKTVFIDGIPYHFKQDGQKVQAFNIHCIGGNKIYIRSFAQGKIRTIDYLRGFFRYIFNGLIIHLKGK